MVNMVQFLTKVYIHTYTLSNACMYIVVARRCLIYLSVLQSREETVHTLLTEVRQAGKRLKFLMDYAILPEDDIRLNNLTFNWPRRMEPIFEVSQQRLTLKREKVEEKAKQK